MPQVRLLTEGLTDNLIAVILNLNVSPLPENKQLNGDLPRLYWHHYTTCCRLH